MKVWFEFCFYFWTCNSSSFNCITLKLSKLGPSHASLNSDWSATVRQRLVMLFNSIHIKCVVGSGKPQLLPGRCRFSVSSLCCTFSTSRFLVQLPLYNQLPATVCQLVKECTFSLKTGEVSVIRYHTVNLFQDSDQIEPNPSPLQVNIQDPDLHPLPRSQHQTATTLANRQLVQSDVALVDEAWAPNADIYKCPEQCGVVHTAREHRTHLQITHRHDAPLKVRLAKIWRWQKKTAKMRAVEQRLIQNHETKCLKPRKGNADELVDRAEMANGYNISSSHLILASTCFHTYQQSIQPHFPLSLLIRSFSFL